jgi:hypothetical protein
VELYLYSRYTASWREQGRVFIFGTVLINMKAIGLFRDDNFIVFQTEAFMYNEFRGVIMTGCFILKYKLDERRC